MAGVVCVDKSGDEAAEGSDDGGGVFEEWEVLERGAVGAVEQAPADERVAEIVAAEAAGDGGVELIDKVEDGEVVDCGGLVKVASGVEER